MNQILKNTNIKKILFIAFLLLGIKQSHAQSYLKLESYVDTANYLIHEIEMKKTLFKNKPLSVLLDSLKVEPMYSNKGYTKPNSPSYGKTLYINFNVTDVFEQEHFIIVDFVTAPNIAQLNSAYTNRFTVEGQQQLLNLYKPLLVKEVYVKNYQDDDPPRAGITDNSKL